MADIERYTVLVDHQVQAPTLTWDFLSIEQKRLIKNSPIQVRCLQADRSITRPDDHWSTGWPATRQN